jgi:hypothetical protein
MPEHLRPWWDRTIATVGFGERMTLWELACFPFFIIKFFVCLCWHEITQKAAK